MPMPALDPDRYVAAVLADPTHRMPMPDRGGRLFRPVGETVDTHDHFYAALFADGSLRRATADEIVAAAAAEQPTPEAPVPEAPASEPAADPAAS